MQKEMNMSEYIDFSSFCRFNHLQYVFHAYGLHLLHLIYSAGTERNDVDSIIIEELAYYCFSSHFFTHLIALICSLSLNLESSFVSFPSRTAS